jgi:calcium-activated chloride channel regulator 4
MALQTTRKSLSALSFVGLLSTTFGLLISSPVARAGTGSIDTNSSTLDLSVLFAFSENDENLGGLTNLESWRKVFDDASARLWNATNGQLKIGKVKVYRRAFTQKDSADVWILPGDGTAYSNGTAQLGVPGFHCTLFGNRHRSNKATFRGGFSVLHELSHYVFGLYDQYQGGFVPLAKKSAWTYNDLSPIQRLSVPVPPNIMAGGGGVGNTATEFDTVADVMRGQAVGKNWWMTENWIMNRESSWETLGKFLWNGTVVFPNVPLNGSSDPTMPPGNTDVTWEVIPDVSRLAVVIDRSGSMSSENRMELAKLGAGFMVGLTTDRHTVSSYVNGVADTNEYPADRLTVIDFDDQVTELLPITEVDSAGAVRVQARSQIATLSPGGSTAIGHGVQKAVEIFDADSSGTVGSQENIIVLSDGMDNSSNVTPMAAASANAAGRGAKIYSIALGNGADSTGLQQMADATGGKFFQCSDGLGLIDVYSRIYGELRGGGIMESLASLLFENSTSSTVIPVDELSEEVTFAMSSPSTGFTVQLTSPGGTKYTQTTPADGVFVLQDTNSTVFRVSKPVKGNWTLSVVAPNTNTGTNHRYNLMANATSPAVSVSPSVASKTVSYPNPVLITCPVTAGGPVAGASVTAEVTGPNGSVGSMMLYDDGAAIHGDKVAGDGIYSGYYGAFPKNGVYSFLVKAVNVKGYTAIGESENSATPPTSAPVPPFTRVAYTTAAVSGVPANLSTDWMRVDAFSVARKTTSATTAGMRLRCTFNAPKGSLDLGGKPLILTLDNTTQITVAADSIRKTKVPGVFTLTDSAQGISGSIISEIGGTTRNELILTTTKLPTANLDFNNQTEVKLECGAFSQTAVLSNQTANPPGLSITYLAGNNFAVTPALHVDGLNASISARQNNTDVLRFMGTYQGSAKYNPVTDSLTLDLGFLNIAVPPGTLKVTNTRATGSITVPNVGVINITADSARRIISISGNRLNLGTRLDQTATVRLQWGTGPFDQSCSITMQSALRAGTTILNY